MIDLRNIHYQYNSRQVLNGVNFRINPGDRIGLTGPNGAGKTTLAHIIMGLLIPNRGEVCIFDSRRSRESDFAEVRQRIGFLFQDPDDQLFCPTVLDDVAFGPLNLGKDPQEAKSISLATLATLGLEGFEDRITHELSGGEKRLVSLATVLAMNPEALILDEPVTGLDEETTDRIAHILIQSNLTYVVISHDREFLQKTTTRIVMILDGMIAPVHLEKQPNYQSGPKSTT